MITAIPPHLVAYVWPQVSRFVQNAADHIGDYDADDMLTPIADGRVILLVCGEMEGVLLMELHDTPKRRICTITAAGGKGLDKYLAEGIETAKALAREQGATELRVNGRRGWERALKNHGFAHRYTALGVEL